MATLFYLDKKFDVILHEECYKVCPQLRSITKPELLYIILVFDYKSPYHQFPEEERKRKAKHHVWSTKEVKNDGKDSVMTAIDLYMSLQYDPRREKIKTYRKKQDQIQRQFETEDSPHKIKSWMETIEMLEKNCKDIQLEIDLDEQEVDLKGGGKKSLLETLHDNKQLYDLVDYRSADNIEIRTSYADSHEE